MYVLYIRNKLIAKKYRMGKRRNLFTSQRKRIDPSRIRTLRRAENSEKSKGTADLTNASEFLKGVRILYTNRQS